MHMIVDKDKFLSLNKSIGNQQILTGKKDAAIKIEGTREAVLITKDANLTLLNVAWVPESTVNLISLGALMSHGADLQVERNASPCTFQLLLDGKIMLSGHIRNNLFLLDMQSFSHHAHYSDDELLSIHRSLGHASIGQMEKYPNSSIPTAQKNNFECISCDKAKISCKPFDHLQQKAHECFEKIHLNLIGPINPVSKGGFRYILNLINSHSGYISCFPLKNKIDTTETLIFIIENQNRKSNQYPKEVCSNGGGKFVNSKLQSYYRSHHINQMVNKPYHSQHNGQVKQANITIIESARATISELNLPKSCWHEVIRGCSLMLNQIPKEKGDLSPWEKMHGKSLPKDYVKPLGTSLTYRLNDTQIHSKLDKKELLEF